MLDLKIKNHAALEALTKGNATRADIDTLVAMVNMSEAFARLGFGDAYSDVVLAGLQALRHVGKRGAVSGSFILKAHEMNALNTAMELHDAQMEVVTLKDMDAAIALVREEYRLKKMTPITEKV
jgi:5-formyltetrahydrofolate cyclo-ligase